MNLEFYKAKEYDGRKLVGAWAEVKENGHCVAVKREDNETRVFGRGFVDVTKDYYYRVPTNLPNNTILMGEMYVPGCEASEVVTARIAQDPRLTFCCFAIPYLEGKDLRLVGQKERDQILEALDIVGPSVVPLAIATKENATRLGIEGYVLKEFNFYSWWKIKPTKSIDCVVMSTCAGLGKHNGRLGSLVVGVQINGKLQVVANVGKGKDELWRDLKPEECIGRVVEVEYESLQAKGKLKFGGSFLRWRDDKPASECVLP